jgi:hypothetical protein
MTKEKKTEMLSLMLEDEDENLENGILEVYLELAGQKILNRMYPYKENYDGLDVPDRYVGAQLKIAHYMINKRGAEGQIQHIENGIHRNYGAADVPDGMLAEIVPYCQAIR